MGQEVKNHLRAQFKYGLMGSSAKTGKFCFRGSPEHFLDKNAIWDRTPPHLHINCSLHMWGCSRVPNLQMEFNYLNSFKSYGIFSDFVVPMVPMLSTSSLSSPCHPCHPIAPRRSPCGLSGLLRCLHGLHPMWSLLSPRHPRVIPIIPMLSP